MILPSTSTTKESLSTELDSPLVLSTVVICVGADGFAAFFLKKEDKRISIHKMTVGNMQSCNDNLCPEILAFEPQYDERVCLHPDIPRDEQDILCRQSDVLFWSYSGSGAVWQFFIDLDKCNNNDATCPPNHSGTPPDCQPRCEPRCGSRDFKNERCVVVPGRLEVTVLTKLNVNVMLVYGAKTVTRNLLNVKLGVTLTLSNGLVEHGIGSHLPTWLLFLMMLLTLNGGL